MPNDNPNPDWGESNFWQWQGFSCHWRVIGTENTRPLVFLHGFGASTEHWRHNAFPFAKAGFRVYGIDLIGFGKSDQPGVKEIKRLDNHLWARQVTAFLQEIVETNKRGKAVLIGNSLGSLTALTTAVIRPEIVAAVIAAPLPDPALMNPMSFDQTHWMKKLKTFLVHLFFYLFPLELLIPIISRTSLLKIALQSAYFKSITFDKDLLRLVSQPAKRATAPQSLRAMCIGMSLRPREFTAPHLLEVLSNRSSRQPFLMIWGCNDNFVPLMLGQKLQRQHPWLSLYEMKSTGHCPHDESPQEFNKKVLSWLDLNSVIN